MCINRLAIYVTNPNISKSISIFWFRRDLRLHDNAGLYHALKNSKNVLPLFIFDTEILGKLDNKEDKRVAFIHWALSELQKQLAKSGSSLLTMYGKPQDVYKKLIADYNIEAVYTNHDYEPAAIKRDRQIQELLKENRIPLFTFKDQVIFEKQEVTKDNGLPYTVFTPYMRKWKSKLIDFYLRSYPNEKYFSNFIKDRSLPFLLLSDIGFQPATTTFSVPVIDEHIISGYNESRDFPATAGTSRLSVHLRFGTVSIRGLARKAIQLNDTWLNEL